MTTLATNFYGGKKGIKKRLVEIMVGTTSIIYDDVFKIRWMH